MSSSPEIQQYTVEGLPVLGHEHFENLYYLIVCKIAELYDNLQIRVASKFVDLDHVLHRHGIDGYGSSAFTIRDMRNFIFWAWHLIHDDTFTYHLDHAIKERKYETIWTDPSEVATRSYGNNSDTSFMGGSSEDLQGLSTEKNSAGLLDMVYKRYGFGTYRGMIPARPAPESVEGLPAISMSHVQTTQGVHLPKCVLRSDNPTDSVVVHPHLTLQPATERDSDEPVAELQLNMLVGLQPHHPGVGDSPILPPDGSQVPIYLYMESRGGIYTRRHQTNPSSTSVVLSNGLNNGSTTSLVQLPRPGNVLVDSSVTGEPEGECVSLTPTVSTYSLGEPLNNGTQVTPTPQGEEPSGGQNSAVPSIPADTSGKKCPITTPRKKISWASRNQVPFTSKTEFPLQDQYQASQWRSQGVVETEGEAWWHAQLSRVITRAIRLAPLQATMAALIVWAAIGD